RRGLAGVEVPPVCDGGDVGPGLPHAPLRGLARDRPGPAPPAPGGVGRQLLDAPPRVGLAPPDHPARPALAPPGAVPAGGAPPGRARHPPALVGDDAPAGVEREAGQRHALVPDRAEDEAYGQLLRLPRRLRADAAVVAADEPVAHEAEGADAAGPVVHQL